MFEIVSQHSVLWIDGAAAVLFKHKCTSCFPPFNSVSQSPKISPLCLIVNLLLFM